MKTNFKFIFVSKLFFIMILVLFSCTEDRIIAEDALDADNATEIDASIAARVNEGHGNQTISMKPWTRGAGNDCKPHREVVTKLHKYLDTRNYRVEFEVKFSRYFDFDRGGKFGYGMVVGKGVTGCKGQRSKNNEGGSFRVMWRNRSDPASPKKGCIIEKEKNTTAQIIPYLYFRDMQGDCGNDFGKGYDIERNKWYRIVMTFKSNTSRNKNGTAKLQVGPSGGSLTTVLNRTNIRWSETSDNQKVTELYYHFFRGGNTKDWASHVGGDISVRNVKLGN